MNTMNKISKTIFAVLLFLALPMKHWAQTPFRPYAEEGISLNFFEIDNHDFRLFLLYQLSQDQRFVLSASEENGLFSVSADEGSAVSNFLETFETFYQNTLFDFGMLSKYDIYNNTARWKAGVNPADFMSITMDLALNNVTRDNDSCVNSDPFCTSDTIQFEASHSNNEAEEVPDDGCLINTYNPSWFHMRINVPGQFIIHMEGVDPDNSNIHRDIDFCIWGPFDDPVAPCVAQLTSDKIIDCNYSTSYSEDIYLGYPESAHVHQTGHGTINEHTPEEGEYYILLITNYSREPCVISFTKIPGSGPGETDCGILPGIVNNDGPYCVGDDIHLTVNSQPNATYQWSGPNGYSSNDQNPTIPNCTQEMAGPYSCTTTIDNQTTTSTTEVVIYPQPTADFTFVPVCEGEPIQFTSTSTTNPSGGEIMQMWNFGDGQTGTGTNPSHLYNGAGEYEVTLTVTTGEGQCTDSKTRTVSVYAIPVITATASPEEVPYGQTATLTATVATQGSFTYHWTPENKVTDPNSAVTQTIPIQEPVVFTVTVTNQQGGCVSTELVSVGMEGSNLTATVSADETELCQGESTTLHATPHNGTGNYTYQWSGPNNFSSNEQHPTITPPVGTSEYICYITDDLTSKSDDIYITVHPEIMEADTIYDNAPCDSVVFTWQGRDTVFYANTVHRFLGQTEHGCPHEQTIRITNMEYTPQPKIMSNDALSHYPITATEFLVNQYTYYITDNISNISHWNTDQCGWSISYPSWRIVESEDKLSCKLYPMDHTDDTVWLSFTAVNACDSVTYKYFLVSSFYSIDDQDLFPVSVSVIPNPNNGQMELRFDNMEGEIDVKVYNTAGMLEDHFEIKVMHNPYQYQYSMKRLSDGVYFFVFNDGKRCFTKKVVIIH